MKKRFNMPCVCEDSFARCETLIKELRLETPEVYLCAQHMALLSEARRKKEEAVFCVLPFCHTLEGEALGGGIAFGRDGAVPRTSSYVCKVAEDVLSRFKSDAFRREGNKCLGGRMAETLEACRRLAESGSPVMLMVNGPFTILNVLMDAIDLFRMVDKEWGFFSEILWYLRRFLLNYISAAKEAGVQVISYGDALGVEEMIGPELIERMTEEFTVPFLREAGNLAKGKPLIVLCPRIATPLFECGRAGKREVVIPGMSYEKGCQWLSGKAKFAGDMCIKNMRVPLREGVLPIIELY